MFIARYHIPGIDVVVDPCAAILVLIVTGLLCMGIKEVIFYYYKLLINLNDLFNFVTFILELNLLGLPKSLSSRLLRFIKNL